MFGVNPLGNLTFESTIVSATDPRSSCWAPPQCWLPLNCEGLHHSQARTLGYIFSASSMRTTCPWTPAASRHQNPDNRGGFNLCLPARVPTPHVPRTGGSQGTPDLSLWEIKVSLPYKLHLFCQILGFIAKGSYGPIVRVKDNFKDQVFAVKVCYNLYISTIKAGFVHYIVFSSLFSGSA